jgi:hypothetical protein
VKHGQISISSELAAKCFGIEHISAEKSCAIIPPGETLGSLKAVPVKEGEMHTTAIRGECFDSFAQAKTSGYLCKAGSRR